MLFLNSNIPRYCVSCTEHVSWMGNVVLRVAFKRLKLHLFYRKSYRCWRNELHSTHNPAAVWNVPLSKAARPWDFFSQHALLWGYVHEGRSTNMTPVTRHRVLLHCVHRPKRTHAAKMRNFAKNVPAMESQTLHVDSVFWENKCIKICSKGCIVILPNVWNTAGIWCHSASLDFNNSTFFCERMKLNPLKNIFKNEKLYF